MNVLLISLSLLQMKGFTQSKITSHHPYEKEWDVPSHIPSSKLNEILSQPYHYLASGKECYVFESNDKQYVIKFFKQKHMHGRQKRRKTLRKKTFTSYKIAYEKLEQETQLLYLHLTKTAHLKKKLSLIDNHNRPFTLDLDKMEFLIQRRGTTLLTYLKEHPQEKNELLLKLSAFIKNRAEKGICDSDNNCERNLGILNGEIFEIDIGEFSYTTEPIDIQKAIDEATQDLLEIDF